MSKSTEVAVTIDALTPPLTPPWEKVVHVHNWPEPEYVSEEKSPEWQYQNGRLDGHWLEGRELSLRQHIEGRRRQDSNQTETTQEGGETEDQQVLLLHAPKQRYMLTSGYAIPERRNNSEMLVKVEVVGLNPIDWKAPDFGFGLPSLPCISGRDLAGTVAREPRGQSRFQVGDKIMAVSTDYRDSRKSAYQQYTIVSDFNACKLPSNIQPETAAPMGVAFVAAALALGVCLGVNFSSTDTWVDNGDAGSSSSRSSDTGSVQKVDREDLQGPDLLEILSGIERDDLPKDTHAECFDGIIVEERARKGDWIAIWGGSSASGCCAVQLAKLCGLHVIAVIDVARSGERMLRYGADLLVDRLDTERVVSIVRGITRGKLRFGLDTIGQGSAALLAAAMRTSDNNLSNGINGNAAISKDLHRPSQRRAHLVGLSGLPKEATPGVVYHSVPVKLFHEAPAVGSSLMRWLETLLTRDRILTPDIVVQEGGLAGVNDGLDKLRDGRINGPRIVVPI